MFNNTRQKEINGKQVTIYLLPATKGLVVAKKLSQTIMPAMSGLASLGTDGDFDMSMIATMLSESLDNLDVVETVKTLLGHALVDGQEIDFDTFFMGNYGMLVSMLVFALEENFASFFGGKDLGGLIKSKLSQTQTPVELKVE